MTLRHADGEIEETHVQGPGAIAVGSVWRFPSVSDHWWKVVALDWRADGVGHAVLEPTEDPNETLAAPPI